MRRLFLGMLLLGGLLFGEGLAPEYFATVEPDPSAVVAGVVNAITGQLYISSSDMLAPGYQPILHGRSYISMVGDVYPMDFKIWVFGGFKATKFADLNRLNIINIKPVKIDELRQL